MRLTSTERSRLVAVRLGRVVLRDQAAQHHARKRIHQREHGVEDRAADVLEIHVHAVRAGVAQLLREVAGLVIDAGVEAQLLHHVVALRLPARDADRAATLDLRELPGHAADRPGGRGDDQRFARLGLADLVQPEPRGDARHAEQYRDSTKPARATRRSRSDRRAAVAP